MNGRSVKFKINLNGYARAWVPEDITDSMLSVYLSDYAPMYAGNKMWDVDVIQISDVEPDE